MSEATRSVPSIYSDEYQRIVDRVNAATNPIAYHKACQELLIYVDLYVDDIRLKYEARGTFQPLQAGTMVYCKVEDHLVRCGRVYGHRITEVSGSLPKHEYWVQLFYDGDNERQMSDHTKWILASEVFDKAEEAFK